MLRNKYKYAKNWGLLPLRQPPSPVPSIKTYAILEEQTLQQYEVRVDPTKQSTFVLYNDREYLHRQCTHLAEHSNPNLLQEVARHYQRNMPSLTVFLVNEPVKAQQLIVGIKQNDSLISKVYERMVAERQTESQIVMSVIGVESENLLTDQLRTMEQVNEDVVQGYLPELKVARSTWKSGKHHLENVVQKKVDSPQALRNILEEYTRNKNESEYMALSRQNNWDWLQGELFVFYQLADDQDYPGIKRSVKQHFVLRINQYLKSTSNIMLKMGILLRKYQEKQRDLSVDLNESKLFKILSSCFSKGLEGPAYDIHMFLQVGCSLTLKEEYLNLAPTCGLKKPSSLTACYEEVAFMYVKHFYNYPQLVNKIEALQRQDQQRAPKNIADYVDSPDRKLPNIKTPTVKSYVMDTFSSLEKKVIRPEIQEEVQQQENEQQQGDLQSLVKKTAQLYRQGDNIDLKTRSAHQTKMSIRSRPCNKRGMRLSFADGHMTRQKIYANRKPRSNNASLQDVGSTFKRSKYNSMGSMRGKCFSSYHKRQLKKDQRVTSLHSGENEQGEEKGGETKDMIDKIVKREILELGIEQFYRPDDF